VDKGRISWAVRVGIPLVISKQDKSIVLKLGISVVFERFGKVPATAAGRLIIAGNEPPNGAVTHSGHEGA
jgi:hypothetical protein